MSLDYKSAISKIIKEELKGNIPVPDILSSYHLNPLYGKKLIDILDKLFLDYETKEKSPEPLLRIDVPKPDFTIRPMSMPENKDWILFEAIIGLIASEIIKDESICKRSYSFLNCKPETAWKNNWTKFDDKCIELYTLGYKYAVVADLTGYYENISLTELRKRIVNYFYLSEEEDKGKINEKAVDVLFKMLNKWSDERVSGYGLPQGPPASAFLADIYLDYVDCSMESYEHYYRYMDDIRLFCKTEIEAKKALKDLIIALRNIKLNINAKKTRILKEKEIELHFFDPLKSSLQLIETILKDKNISQIKKIVPLLIKIFEGSFLEDPFEKRHLNFSLYRLSNLQASGVEIDSNKIKRTIIENFVVKPHHTGLFCFFLTLFRNEEKIPEFFMHFIQSENNIYDWQAIKVLQSLLRFNVKLAPQHIRYLMESAKNSNQHFAARAFYFLLVGKQGSNRDRELIVDYYNNSLHQHIKVSIVLAVQELGQASRNEFYSRVKRDEGNSEIGKFIDYVKSLKHPLYYIDAERPKIELLEEGEPSPYL